MQATGPGMADIVVWRGKDEMKLRLGTTSGTVLIHASLKWGLGRITDKDGYEVTKESPILPAERYEYQLPAGANTLKPCALMMLESV